MFAFIPVLFAIGTNHV